MRGKIMKLKEIVYVKKIDCLGRVTLPKIFRELFGMTPDKDVEIVALEEGILIRRKDDNELTGARVENEE